jgi:hypothetical protein
MLYNVYEITGREHPICAISINTQKVSVLEYDTFKALLSHNKRTLYHSVLWIPTIVMN